MREIPVAIKKKKDAPPAREVTHRGKERNRCGGTVEIGKRGRKVRNGHGGGGTMKMKRKRERDSKIDDDDDAGMDDGDDDISNISESASQSELRSSEKRGGGWAPGSGRLHLLASLGSFVAEIARGILVPHVIVVNKAEDIISKILSFAGMGSLAVCVLSATGVVSSAVIRSSGGRLRYQGFFEIISLSGSFTIALKNGETRKIGTLSVSLANSDGQVFGGGVVGSLIASCPIQVIVASFKQNIITEFAPRQPAESSTCRVPGNSEEVRFPVKTAGSKDGGDQENSNTPKSAVLGDRKREAGSSSSINQQKQPVSQNGGWQKVFSSPSDRKVTQDINVRVPELEDPEVD